VNNPDTQKSNCLHNRGVLAIETATEACSVALYREGAYEERHEEAPRQHNERVFSMLRELLPDGDLRAHGIGAIAWGSGPGSFTGLRIAASAVQGLAFANDLPAVGVSTLACQAQTALRLGAVSPTDTVLSLLDARINEIYWASFVFVDGLATLRSGPGVCSAGSFPLPAGAGDGPLLAVGSGCRFVSEMPAATQAGVQVVAPQLLPAARDLIPLALVLLQQGVTQRPEQVQPVYVRDEINWKKLPEQGRRK
jgi:tRNA threonylcarbamoyladenosine biosynthesis protein TsaB